MKKSTHLDLEYSGGSSSDHQTPSESSSDSFTRKIGEEGGEEKEDFMSNEE
jgi:hypothetical protein